MAGAGACVFDSGDVLELATVPVRHMLPLVAGHTELLLR